MKLKCECIFPLIIFLLFSISVDAQRISSMPNLIILLADDLGYGELGCQGNREYPHEWLFWRQSHKTAFRVGDMKILRQSPKKWELYDLGKYPAETKDLILEQPKQFNLLFDGWEKINGNMIDPHFR